MTRFQISSLLGQVGTIHIDGIRLDVPLRRITFDSRAGELPVLYLEAVGDQLIAAEGVVLQRLGAVDDPSAPSVAEFLSELDPDALEQAAAGRLGGLGDETTGQAFLAVLKELAGCPDPI